MNQIEFQRQIKDSPLPVIVDLWAPWCAPCRAMEPAMRRAAQQYKDQVAVLKVNADESPEVLKSLGVMGIPTLVGFAQGQEIFRRTGRPSDEALDLLFEAALNQRKPGILPPAPLDRLLRSGAGLALAAYGWFSGPSWLLIGLGAVVLFSAFYDRCPIFRAVWPRLTALFSSKS